MEHLQRNVVRFPHNCRGTLLAAWSPCGEGIVAEYFNVRPLGPGWRLQGEGLEPMVFAHGGHAEQQARRLARCIARQGRDARVNVYDARGELAGSINYFGCRTPPGPEASERYPWAQDPFPADEGTLN